MVPEPERARRTYFNHPLVAESLQCLPSALDDPSVEGFRKYVVEHVPQNSLKGRKRIAGYLVHRFSHEGQMNLPLAAAIAQYGDSQISREILYFELLRVYPILEEIAIHWLAELPEGGGSRDSLKEFLSSRIPGRSAEKVTKDSLTTMKQCGKVSRPKTGWYVPLFSAPPLEVFLYVLARLYPDKAMVPIQALASESLLRGMLWPTTSIDGLLLQAEQAGHISKISRLDQYHQFTTAGSGLERLRKLLPNLPKPAGTLLLFESRTSAGI